jgi:hypothetical protein
MKNMITQGWSINPKERPSFETIINHLKDELTELDPKLAAMVEDSAELSNDQIN